MLNRGLTYLSLISLISQSINQETPSPDYLLDFIYLSCLNV